MNENLQIVAYLLQSSQAILLYWISNMSEKNKTTRRTYTYTHITSHKCTNSNGYKIKYIQIHDNQDTTLQTDLFICCVCFRIIVSSFRGAGHERDGDGGTRRAPRLRRRRLTRLQGDYTFHSLLNFSPFLVEKYQEKHSFCNFIKLIKQRLHEQGSLFQLPFSRVCFAICFLCNFCV